MGTKTNQLVPVATHQDFPIVGVGASAGGLDAFKQFLSAIDEKSGMAYVLVQHLDPSHESILTSILSHSTTIPVHEITDEIHLAPDNIYVIPENKILTSTDGILQLSPRGKQKNNHSIDIFFKSLAEVHLDLAVGVVLSGTGTDGTQGLKEIKAHGGITFAQSQDSATFKEMPENAALSDCADYILAAKEIPGKLLQIISEKAQKSLEIPNNESEIYQEINSLLSDHSGADFSHYNESTRLRRIARQMSLNKITILADYLQLLRENKLALSALFNDLLIPVTSFFRDQEIFNQLSAIVFPVLLEKNATTKSIRIWSAGCSTGEEPYSLAITLLELLGDNTENIQIKIFASDISEISIAKARKGSYSTEQVENIPKNILKKYFLRKAGRYEVITKVRELCIFAVQNFLKDPPFAKMDLITCRNVLIYMDSFLQKKALSTFHYALSDGGYLMLGKSESTVHATSLFGSVDKTEKIFLRRQVSGQFVYEHRASTETKTLLKPKTPARDIPKADFLRSAEAVLLSTFIPASVIIDEQFEVVHFNGDITPYLSLSNRKATFNLLKIAKQRLTFDIRNAVHQANETQSLVIKSGIAITFNEVVAEVTIKVQPLKDTAEPYYLILFEKVVMAVKNDDRENFTNGDAYDQKRIGVLEKELIQTHSDVNAITEELETSNQDLQSLNEELLSGSEELQSLNEELETSKEELQSSNQELNIINDELLKKQDEINISREYTEAIVATLREPIVILDTTLRIKNINNAFSAKYNVTNKEVEGKLIYEILDNLFNNVIMQQLLEKVLAEKAPLENYQLSVNLTPDSKSIMLLNARQIKNEKSDEKLILLALEDITSRKRIEACLKELSDGFEAKVKERTSELENSIAALHKANLRLQQFAYIASHDLQEPLRKILVFTSVLQKEENHVSESGKVILNKINKSSDRMKTLIHDLLAYSSLGDETVLFVPTDLNVVLKNIMVDFELLIEEKNAIIKIGILPIIHAIPQQMNQLLYNLMSNALKFLRSDIPAVIEISSSLLSKKQLLSYPHLNQNISWCEIIFKDNGIGFEQQYERQIFTIFQRLNSNESFAGTGIGLTISNKIVENHSGIIFAESKINDGAVFHIILPMNAFID